jgi:hypothetical protein
VFDKTNSCIETPDTDNLIDLDSNMNVNLDKPRPRSVAGCDPPWRRSNEGRKEQSVVVAKSGNSASENVGRLRDKVKRKPVEVRNSAITERVCGTTPRSKAVTNSEGEHLDAGRTACELHVGSNSGRAYVAGVKMRKTTIVLCSLPWWI